MKIKIYKLNGIKKIIGDKIVSLEQKLDKASTSVEYYALVSIERDLMDLFNNSIEFDKDDLQAFFTDHPFKKMGKNCNYRGKSYNDCDINLRFDYEGAISFRTHVNSLSYTFDYYVITKEFDFMKTSRKNDAEIQEYFTNKINEIEFEIVGY